MNILLDTALLAKEKGFKDRTKSFYNHDVFHVEDKKHIPDDWDWNSSFIERCSAPIQSELQTWLRVKHKCIVIVDFYNDGEEWEKTEYDVKVSEFQHFGTHDSFVKADFKSYEEALESGLVEALKLI